MSKRKVCVEALVDYIYRYFDKTTKMQITGRVKINGLKTIVEIDLKSKKNAGGEAWDWAQSHWDEFLDESGPSVTVDLGDGVSVTLPTELRWACVTGVYGPNGGDLAMESVSWKTGRNRSYAEAQKKAKGEKIQKVTVREGGNKYDNCALIDMKTKKKGYSTNTPVIPEDKPNNSKSAEVLSFEDIKAKKIEEAMLAEE